MGWHTTKSFPADVVFSRFVRLRDGKCVLCGRLGTGPDGIFGLQASHFYSRGKWSTRYDQHNVWSLCISDHKKSHQDISEYKNFLIEQLGQQAFDALTVRAWARSHLGSNFWKRLTVKQAEKIFKELSFPQL